MNLNAFRQIIREEVRTAVREELRQVLVEAAASQMIAPRAMVNENFAFNTDNVNVTKPKAALKGQMDQMFGFKTPETERTDLKVQPQAASGNPFEAFLQDTIVNTPPGEFAKMRQQ